MPMMYDSFTGRMETVGGPVVRDDRTAEERDATIGFWVATDSFLSGWGQAKGRSLVACPVVSAADREVVEQRFDRRGEFKRVRYCSGKEYRPRLGPGDHLHIYNTSSFRYAL